jgi:hypothetical protein
MPAGYQELFIEQGTTFTTSITLDDVYGIPYDLTDVVAKGQIKKSYYSVNPTAEFDVSINSPTSGVIVLTLPAETTANVTAGRYLYDVAIKDTANTVTRVLEGTVNVLPQITKF